MSKYISLFLLVMSLCCVSSIPEENLKNPTIFVSILVRNKEHTLPYFLSSLESINYPKNRMTIWIKTDHNIDNSLEILQKWVETVRTLYHFIHLEVDENDEEISYPNEEGIAHWTNDRFSNVIDIRETALNHARNVWADYFLTIDADVFIINPETLNYLISKKFTVVAPMLQSIALYSNFWHGMTEDYYYLRTDAYKPILERQNISCFHVRMVHSCVLIDLRRIESDLLTYKSENIPNYNGPLDDIIIFALSATFNDVPLFLCNEENFGFITVPLEQSGSLKEDYKNLLNIKMEVLNTGQSLYVNDALKSFIKNPPPKDTMMFDKIFMINLQRRLDRRKRMHKCFRELGLEVETINAIDGQTLNETFLQTISFMPNFYDPYHKRPMKLGEIGCFLSHYHVWQKIIENNYKITLVLEDDIKFEPNFRDKVINLMAEVMRIDNWDLVYFGRKRLQDQDEPWVDGTNYLVEVGYSYWTLGYVLSLSGAKKLIDAKPLQKLVPVDEYLPILFDKHPQEDWKRHYPKRDLVAFSAAPLLLHPTHYTGEKGYVSDTEDSVIIPETLIIKDDL